MNPSWKTFESGADEEGFFDPAQELFGRAKTLIDSVVREGGQNTADNGFDSKKPIELYFDVSELNTVDFPGREDVVRILNSCKSYNLNELKLLDDNPAVVFCEDSINKLSDLNGKISFLEIGDSNTTGITGDDHDRTSGWFRMCQSIGVSVGAGTGGGSRGMGKKAPFLISGLKTLFISTKTDSGEAFTGIGQFTSFIESGKAFGAKVKYEMKDKKSVRDEKNIPINFKRKNKGTSIFIAGFNKTPSWENQFIVSVLDNFYAAIYHEKLIVRIGKTEIRKDTIKDLIDGFASNKTKMFFKCLSEGKKISAVLPDVGEVQLYVLLDETFTNPKRIDYMRNKRMKIFDIKRGVYIRDNFAAVFICEGVKGSERLRLMEGAEHVDWKPRLSHIHSDKEYKDKIDNWIFEEIKKFETQIAGKSSFVSGMENKLPMVDAGSGQSQSKGTSGTVKQETAREKIDEKLDEIIIPENSEGDIIYIDPLGDNGITISKPIDKVDPPTPPVDPPTPPVDPPRPPVDPPRPPVDPPLPRRIPKKVHLSQFLVTVIKNDKIAREYHLFIQSKFTSVVILNINICPSSDIGKIDKLRILNSAVYENKTKIRISGKEDTLLNVTIRPGINKYIIETKTDDKYAFKIDGHEN